MQQEIRRLILTFAFVSLPIAAVLPIAQSSPPVSGSTSPSASGLDLSAINRTADPCVDFYQFACSAWTSTNPIPADRPSWGRFNELQEKNNTILRSILEQAAAGRDADTTKIGDYYASCMDEADIEKRGPSPLERQFTEIAALADRSHLAELVADLHSSGVNAFFRFSEEPDSKNARMVIAAVAQGGLGLPERNYYFRTDPKSNEIRAEYVAHVGKMAALAGRSHGDADAASKVVMRMETDLAMGALDVVSRRDPTKTYHKMTTMELQAMTPHFDWARYFREIGAPRFSTLNVSEPDFFKNLDLVLTGASLEDLKAYLTWHLVHARANVLSTTFVNENFRFYNAMLQGVQELRPRWKRCVQYTDGDLGEALGRAFVKQAFGAHAKADTLKMVHEIEAALESDIAALSWMTDATKKQALAKLHTVENKIGYPDRWRDYSKLRIDRGDFAGNAERASAFEFHREMAKIGKPLDKSEWDMTPPTVNAYYEPLENNINFPAGILQPPFYDEHADPAVNYGGAGAVIGHELTHGFDDQGRQYDAKGNLNDWWTASDASAFTERSACFVDEYSNFTAVDDVKLNGRLTLGENTADNGGLRLALTAYLASGAGKEAQTLDDFTPEQRVFLGFAGIWCENRRPEYERMQAQTDPHSPGRYRVNGVVSNMPEFQKAFSCSVDAPMVRKPACRVW